VDTIVVEPVERSRIPQLARDRGWGRVVVKPSLGATAYRSAIVDVNGVDPHAWSRENSDFDGVALVQPFLESIQTSGEVSLIYIDGRYTHAVGKQPAPGDYRVQREFGGSAQLMDPEGDVRRVADKAIAAIPQLPLYARIDVVRDDNGQPRVIECEVIEPELYFDLFVPAAEALAVAVVERIEHVQVKRSG
jgi:glutathione synthase/RimK-type ligase-like ATP-grasp enzyme